MTKLTLFKYKMCSRSLHSLQFLNLTRWKAVQEAILIVKAARNKSMYQSFSTFFAKIFPYPPDNRMLQGLFLLCDHPLIGCNLTTNPDSKWKVVEQ